MNHTWLTKKQLAFLFGCDEVTIDKCLKEASLQELKCHQIKHYVKNKTETIPYYSTEALYSIGYRVNIFTKKRIIHYLSMFCVIIKLGGSYMNHTPEFCSL